LAVSTLYDEDTYTWAIRQADALRRRSHNEVDWENVAEEIESLGKSQAQELRSRYAVLLAHLLKWRFQPERRSNSWDATIRTQRRLIAAHLEDNPGLKSRMEALYGQAYVEARGWAASETDLPLPTFPETTPFDLEDAMRESFWPEAREGE
jgi:ribosomal protein L29